ncbi:MAG TPA: 30S ribosomal protein S6 [Flavobacteriales bacterium]|jgi:small subunit ribosomal protein S6|nr:30S ribosomal protein S6 [Flavobacteriales bacterium]
MTNRYETVFILTPVLSDVQVKEAVKKFESTLKKFSAKVINKEDWALRKLAYPIQKKSTGFYFLFEFEMEGEHIRTLEVELKRDERFIRFLTIKLEKHAVAWADKRKARGIKKAKEESKEQVEV